MAFKRKTDNYSNSVHFAQLITNTDPHHRHHHHHNRHNSYSHCHHHNSSHHQHAHYYRCLFHVFMCLVVVVSVSHQHSVSTSKVQSTTNTHQTDISFNNRSASLRPVVTVDIHLGTELTHQSKFKRDNRPTNEADQTAYVRADENEGDDEDDDDDDELSPSSASSTESHEDTYTDPLDDFCSENYIDSAYFNGYDTILTRGDRLWYYYKDQHRLSQAYDQRKFTQGDHIQGALNISRTPGCSQVIDRVQHGLRSTSVSDCQQVNKLNQMAVYFLHNKDRARSYYNLDVRNPDGTQKRVRSRDLPWGMKQVGLLGGNLWPNGWETYQTYRPVAFLPSRFELIFIINHYHSHQHWSSNGNNSLAQTNEPRAPLLTWNTLDASQWNASWRSKILEFDPPVLFTGMFEMNGIVYAIGERQVALRGRNQPLKRVGKMYRYYVTEDNSRDLRETDQSVRDFFGCPREVSFEPMESTKATSTSTTTSTTTTTTTMATTTTDSTSTTTENYQDNELDSREDFSDHDQRTKMSASDQHRNQVLVTVDGSSVAPTDDHNGQRRSAHNQLSEPNDDPNWNRSNVFLANSPTSSVFLRNSLAKILPVRELDANIPGHRHPKHQVTTDHGHFSRRPPPPPAVTLRETDSILLTIFVGIVVCACIATILLAFLTIAGRKKSPPRFEGARIERTIPKPTIIGLDYHPRKNSSISSSSQFNMMNRYDSMNSLTAIYSKIGKPKVKHSPTSSSSPPPPPMPLPLSSSSSLGCLRANKHSGHYYPSQQAPSILISHCRSGGGVGLEHHQHIDINDSPPSAHKHQTSASTSTTSGGSGTMLCQSKSSPPDSGHHYSGQKTGHKSVHTFHNFDNLLE